MKQLQNNFTTVEQSKKLLEMGVPADSADCYYEMSYRPLLSILPDGVDFSEIWKYFDDEIAEDNDYIPCWSVGRLLEIVDDCCNIEWELNEFYNNIQWSNNKCEELLNRFETHHLDMDFSKLEE